MTQKYFNLCNYNRNLSCCFLCVFCKDTETCYICFEFITVNSDTEDTIYSFTIYICIINYFYDKKTPIKISVGKWHIVT